MSILQKLLYGHACPIKAMPRSYQSVNHFASNVTTHVAQVEGLISIVIYLDSVMTKKD